MRVLILGCVFFGIMISACFAEHYTNGEDWIELDQMDHPGQLYYIAGIMEGMIQGNYEFYYSELHLPVKYERIRLLLNEFYRDYKNIKIPVFHAIRAIHMQLDGSSHDAVEAFLLELRKLSMTLE